MSNNECLKSRGMNQPYPLPWLIEIPVNFILLLGGMASS